MLPEDPLAERHGALIRQVWEQIALARWAAGKGLPPQRAVFWQKRLRLLRRQVRHAQRIERTREDATAVDVDRWFHPVTSTLSRAEAHFSKLAQREMPAPRKAASARQGTAT